MCNIALVTFLGLQYWSASMINIYEHRKTCIFCVLSLVKPTKHKSVLKLSWNFLKIWSWNFTSCCWEPCCILCTLNNKHGHKSFAGHWTHWLQNVWKKQLPFSSTSSFSTFSFPVRSLLLDLSCETASSSRARVCSLSSKSRRNFSFVCENISTFLSSCWRLVNNTTYKHNQYEISKY